MVRYLETFNSGTNYYDQALAEVVMDSVDFDWSPDTEWYTLQ